MAAAALSNNPAVLNTSIAKFSVAERGRLKQSEFVSRKKFRVSATVSSETPVTRYTRPSWSAFELGKSPVWWQASDGRPPTGGGELIVFFNPDASPLKPNDFYGIAFNGGFNQPIMCGGEPRIMTKRDRGNSCGALYSIKINLPKHTLSLEFSFTNGKDWDGPYKMKVHSPPKLRNKPLRAFTEGLAEELSREGACERAIYPDSQPVIDRCPLPAYNPEGWKCDLDINPGCTDRDNPFYDPLANVDDGSCPYVEEESSST